MKNLVLYVHGKGGSIAEAKHYEALLPDFDVIGFDYKSETPWDARIEFPKLYDKYVDEYDKIVLIANSIGAFFSMYGFAQKKIDLVLFISPIVDMEKLILDMLKHIKISEEKLYKQKEILTEFGETLSWKYLCYVRKYPVHWTIFSNVLYGEKDNLTSIKTMQSFVDRVGGTLMIMPNGEHWFHTDEQMSFLDKWVVDRIKYLK